MWIIFVLLPSRYKLSHVPISINRKLIWQILSMICDWNPKVLPSSKLGVKHPGCLCWGSSSRLWRWYCAILVLYILYFIKALRVEQNSHYFYFADNILKCISWKEKVLNLIKVSVVIIPKGLIDNKPWLVLLYNMTLWIWHEMTWFFSEQQA